MFAKIFNQIFDSSIAEDWQVRHVFEDLLKLSDASGVVDMTREAIARRTNVPLDIINRGINQLEEPDPKSRSQVEAGRRLVRLDDHRDWGWFIPNYLKYRKIASEDQRRAKTADRVRRYRLNGDGNAPVTHGNAPVTHGNASNAMQRQRQRQMQESISGGQPQSQGSPITESDISGTVPEMSRTPANLQEVLTEADLRGIPAASAEVFFHHFESSGWIDKNGHPVVSWKSKLMSWSQNERSAKAESAHKAGENQNGNGKDEFWRSKYQLDLVSGEIKKLTDGKAQDALGVTHYTDEERARLKDLKAKRAELKVKLGV